MTSYRTAGLISGLALVAACAPKPPAPPDAAAIRSALTAQERKAVMAMADKDTATLAAVFTPDATWIMQDASTFKGRADIAKGANALFGSFDSLAAGVLTIEKLVVISDTQALTFSHLGFSMTMKGQKKPQTYTNPFADYWVKGADGVWRVAYEVNAGAVVPEPAAPAARTEATPSSGGVANCDAAVVSLKNPNRTCWDVEPTPLSALVATAPAQCGGYTTPAVVFVHVSPAGEVLGPVVVARHPTCAAFAAVVVAQAEDFVFQPASRNGVAVSAWTQLVIRPAR